MKSGHTINVLLRYYFVETGIGLLYSIFSTGFNLKEINILLGSGGNLENKSNTINIINTNTF